MNYKSNVSGELEDLKGGKMGKWCSYFIISNIYLYKIELEISWENMLILFYKLESWLQIGYVY